MTFFISSLIQITFVNNEGQSVPIVNHLNEESQIKVMRLIISLVKQSRREDFNKAKKEFDDMMLEQSKEKPDSSWL